MSALTEEKTLEQNAKTTNMTLKQCNATPKALTVRNVQQAINKASTDAFLVFWVFLWKVDYC